jgi:hypothetical protein
MREVERCNRDERTSGTLVPAARLPAERAPPSQRRAAERERRLAPRGRAAKLAEPERSRS